MAAKLEFLANDAGENEGLGDAGIETFKDDPYASCGREAGQNSRDAAKGTAPVRLTFDLLDVPVAELPGADELRSAISACLDEAADDKVRDFFHQANTLLKEPTIKVLRIADYETKGLVGPPDQSRTAFHSLLKGSGVSSEKSDTSGGSFGIGKNAAFAVSDLRTVFYSTIYEENGAKIFAAQGKVLLVSHKDKDGCPRRAKGYWGEPVGYQAVTAASGVPEWMRRSEVGTSIFSAGFRTEKNWAERIAYALLVNFFAAIEAGGMEFAIDGGRIQINGGTIEALFSDSAIKAAADASGRFDDLAFSASLHRCLRSKEAVADQLQVPGLGDVSLRVLVEEGLPKKVGIVRNGMLITTSLEHFGEKLIRFTGRDFVAIVEPSDEASKILKLLENPKHDGFSANRLDDSAKRASAEIAMRLLGKKLRSTIRDIIAVEAGEEVLLNEMTDFFADVGDRPADQADKDPERFVTEPPVVRRTRKQSPSPDNGTRGGGGVQEGGGGGGDGGGSGHGGGSGGSGTGGYTTQVHLAEIRNRMPATDQSGRTRVVFFTPATNGVIELQLDASGVFNDQTLRIVQTSEGSVTSSGKVRMNVTEGARAKVDLTLSSPYRGPIEVRAMAIEVVAA